MCSATIKKRPRVASLKSAPELLTAFAGDPLPDYYLPPSGPSSLGPSVRTLTCLDPWRECQVLAECRDKDGMAHQGLLPTISASATTLHSATTLANNLTPAGFLNDTTDNPGHCQFHSTHQLSVLH